MEEIKSPVYKEIPVSIDGLKAESLAKFPECTQAPHYYLIDKIIENSTTEGTFDAFISVLSS
jgi:hypothetical protein